MIPQITKSFGQFASLILFDLSATLTQLITTSSLKHFLLWLYGIRRFPDFSFQSLLVLFPLRIETLPELIPWTSILYLYSLPW